MYEELVSALRNCGFPNSYCYCRNCVFAGKYGGSCDLKKLLPAAANAIEELSRLHEAQRQNLITLMNEEPETEWIPVTEALPKERINPNTRDFEYVLCVTIWGDVRPFKYGTPIGQKEAHFWNGNGYVDAYVTHWMPLPSAPEPTKEVDT